jgi:peptidoglycan/xylan/chitin deacetylase (PgdA/CDA1 family)
MTCDELLEPGRMGTLFVPTRIHRVGRSNPCPPYPALFFRAPAGLRNLFLDPVLARLGLQLASWSARGFDTRNGDAESVKNKLLHNLRAGAILLLHDGNAARTPDGIPVILEVLPAVLDYAAAANLRFVTLRLALS